jgi:hypothetical protein
MRRNSEVAPVRLLTRSWSKVTQFTGQEHVVFQLGARAESYSDELGHLLAVISATALDNVAGGGHRGATHLNDKPISFNSWKG